MKTVAIINQKGGVGKSTTAVNLAAAIAASGGKKKNRILLIDLDQQANASHHLGIRPEDQGRALLDAILSPKKTNLDLLIEESGFGVDVIPSGAAMAAAERALSTEIGGEKLLAALIERLRAQKKWDICIIDCSPHFGHLAISALTAADYALVPVECTFFALEGLASVRQTIESVQERLNDKLKLLGVLACRFRKNQSNSADIVSTLRNALGKEMFTSVIAENVRLQEAPSFGQPINVYDKRSQGAKDYAAFANEFLKRLDYARGMNVKKTKEVSARV
jgi:chromosome partitioning protein